jgi:hypothetical protein
MPALSSRRAVPNSHLAPCFLRRSPSKPPIHPLRPYTRNTCTSEDDGEERCSSERSRRVVDCSQTHGILGLCNCHLRRDASQIVILEKDCLKNWPQSRVRIGNRWARAVPCFLPKLYILQKLSSLTAGLKREVATISMHFKKKQCVQLYHSRVSKKKTYTGFF